MKHPARSRVAAFTLIELMIVVALIAIIVVLAAPSFRDMILMQRLRGVNAQLMTDLAFARSEAVSRSTFMQVRFQSNSAMNCYIIFARTTPSTSSQCDCTAAAGSRCSLAPTETSEVKTVQVPTSESVLFAIPAGQRAYFTIEPRTGGVYVAGIPEDARELTFKVKTLIDAARSFQANFELAGKLSNCVPSGSTVGGAAC